MAATQRPQSFPSTALLPLPATAASSRQSGIPLSQVSTQTPNTSPPPAKPIPTWKSQGYRSLSAWMASDDDFFIIRRFQPLNARTILWLQDRVAQLEKDLENFDQEVEKSDPNDQWSRNSSFRWDEKHKERRHALMAELSSRLHQYNQFIETYSKIRARPRADKDQIKNIKNWHARKAIDEPEQYHKGHEGDLISINHRARPPLGRLLEAIPKFDRLPLFREKPLPGVHQLGKTTTYSSNSRLDLFTNVSIISSGLVMLLAPMWWLEFVGDSTKKLAVMTGFICVFVALMSTATVNKPFEIVAATAAYAAVLMVFMQVNGKG